MSKSISINIVKLFSSNVASQFLVVLATPVVTRLYSPKHFGLIQIFEAIAFLLFSITGLKYELAIPMSKNQQEVSASFLLSLFFTCILALCSFAGTLLGGPYIALWFNAPELLRFLWLLPIVVGLYGLANAINYWASREGRFGTIAWAGLGSNLGDRLSTIVLGLVIRASVIGLFIGRLIGSFVHTLIFLASLGREVIAEIKSAQLTVATLWETGRRYKTLPLLKTWNALLTAFSIQLLAIIFGHYFPPDVVGYGSLAIKVVALPTTLLGIAVAQVFFPTASKEYHETGTLSQIVRTMFTRLVQLGMFPMLLLGLLGAPLFSIVFGQQWREAGIYAQFFAAWQFLSLVGFPMDIFTIINRQDIGLFLVIISLIGRTTSLLAGVTLGPPRAAVGLYVFFSVIVLTSSLILKLRLAQVSVFWALRIVLKYFALSGALLLPVKVLSWITEHPAILVSAVLLVTACYAGILVTIEQSLRQFMTTMIKKKFR